MDNFEKIKGYTIDEMAKWLSNIDRCPDNNWNMFCDVYNRDCERCWKTWLAAGQKS